MKSINLICEKCAGTINPKTLKCEYCDTQYFCDDIDPDDIDTEEDIAWREKILAEDEKRRIEANRAGNIMKGVGIFCIAAFVVGLGVYTFFNLEQVKEFIMSII